MKICTTCKQTYSAGHDFCPQDGERLCSQLTEAEQRLASVLAPRFRLVGRLGRGGFGSVFFAEQIAVGNRAVALKVLSGQGTDDPQYLKRFQTEAAAAGRIHHINVVTIHDYGQADDGTPYIAMEFLKGESLGEALKKRGRFPLAEVVEILHQVARGLTAAHRLGIIHRDLKPDNIFLTRDDENALVVKIVDFGIVKLLEEHDRNASTTLFGTPAYMSYDQLSGIKSDNLDARSDVYSLGVLIYELLTGRLPFISDTAAGYLPKHLLEQPPAFHIAAPDMDLPAGVESAVMKALVKDREKRYASALDFAHAMEAAAQASIATAEATSLGVTVRNPGLAGDLLHDSNTSRPPLNSKLPEEYATRLLSRDAPPGPTVKTPRPSAPERVRAPVIARAEPHRAASPVAVEAQQERQSRQKPADLPQPEVLEKIGSRASRLVAYLQNPHHHDQVDRILINALIGGIVLSLFGWAGGANTRWAIFRYSQVIGVLPLLLMSSRFGKPLDVRPSLQHRLLVGAPPILLAIFSGWGLGLLFRITYHLPGLLLATLACALVDLLGFLVAGLRVRCRPIEWVGLVLILLYVFYGTAITALWS
jgi:serine/threonine protein kinase